VSLERDRSGRYILRFWTNGHRPGSRYMHANFGAIPCADAVKCAAAMMGKGKTRRTSADPRLTFGPPLAGR